MPPLNGAPFNGSSFNSAEGVAAMPMPRVYVPRRPGAPTHLKRQLRQVIYRLKFKWGWPADVYLDTPGEFDVKTGKRTVARQSWHVKHLIVLPALQHRDVFYTITFIKANSNFVTGGEINIDDRHFILDGRELPRGFVLTENHYVMWNHQKYTIVSLYHLEGGTGWYIVGRALKGETKYEIHSRTLRDKLTLSESYSVEE